MVVWKFTHNQIDAVRFYQLLLSSDLCWSCCQCRGTWRLFFTYLEKLRTGPGEDRMVWNISFIPSGAIDGLLIRFSFYGIYDMSSHWVNLLERENWKGINILGILPLSITCKLWSFGPTAVPKIAILAVINSNNNYYKNYYYCETPSIWKREQIKWIKI